MSVLSRKRRDRPDYTNSGCLILLATFGNSNWKIEPPFARGDTQIRPSWFSMIDWQIERPIPIPRALVVNIGLKSWATSDDLMPVPVSSIDTYTVLDCAARAFAMNPSTRWHS